MCIAYDVKRRPSTALAAHDSWVRAMDVSSQHDQLITGGYDGRMVWWSVSDPKLYPFVKSTLIKVGFGR